MKYLACLILLVSSVALAKTEAECAQVENARERLACFDRLFPSSDRPTPTPAAKSEPKKAPVPVQSSEPLPQRSVPLPDTRQSAPVESKLPSKGGMFDKGPTVNLTATIKAVRRADQQKMMFLLDNDELWMQVTARTLRIRKGDLVSIKSARIGGYMLQTDGGISTRVTRIK